MGRGLRKAVDEEGAVDLVGAVAGVWEGLWMRQGKGRKGFENGCGSGRGCGQGL